MNIPHVAQQQAQALTRNIIHTSPFTALSVYTNPLVTSTLYVVAGKVRSVFFNRPAGGQGISSFYLGPASDDPMDALWHNTAMGVLSDIIVQEGYYSGPTRDKIKMMWMAGPSGRSGPSGLHQATMLAIDHCPPITNLAPTNLTVGSLVRALVQLVRHEKLGANGQVEQYLYVMMLHCLEIVSVPDPA